MKLKARFRVERTPTSKDEREAPVVADSLDTTPPAARNLALAHHLARLIDRGLVSDYSQAARMLSVSQPRVTHLMGLLLLSPDIQEAILELGDKRLRTLSREANWEDQAAALRAFST